MKAFLQGVAVVSLLLLLLLPTSIGWISTDREFIAQLRFHGDDGERYILPSELPHSPEAILLADALFLCCNDSGSILIDEVVQEWTAIAHSHGWAATMTTDMIRTDFNGQPHSYSVALIDRAGQAVPLLLTESDNLFVAGYQPGTGNVLYRRRAFDSAWAGIVIRLEHQPSEDPQP